MSDEKKKAYGPPVDRLLSIGEVVFGKPWPDYVRRYKLAREDVPELVRMVQDEELNLADENSDEVWAPLHAWRALGQLRAEEAVEGLLDALYLIDETDDDWIQEELPVVLGYIGPAALPAVADYLADGRRGEFPRIAAARAVSEIGQRHTESRERCIALLSEQLAQHNEEDDALNGFLVSNLIDLNAVEAAPVIKRAYAADCVDPMIVGDWYDVRSELGLVDESEIKDDFHRWLRSPGAERRRARGQSQHGQQASWDKVGRNDPCPCGSGKKYKYCHGRPA